MSNSLRAALARAINRDDEVRVNLVLSPSLEASFDTLNDIDGVYFQRLGLETQQIDAHITKIVEQAIEEATNPPPSPTIPTVYAVGVKALQEGNLGEQSTLRAAVQDRIENNSEVILALLPAETAADVRAQQEAEASASDEEEPKVVSDNSGIIDAAKQFVGSVEIPVVESLEALQEHLKRYEGLSKSAKPATVSTEAVVEGLIFLGVTAAAFVAARQLGKGIGKLFNWLGKKGNPDNDSKLRGSIKASLKDTYGNEAWLNKQRLVTEPISLHGIGPYLCLNGRFPSDLPKAVNHYVGIYLNWYEAFWKQYSAYNVQINTVWDEMLKIAEQSGVEEAAKHGQSKLRSLKTPGSFFNPPLRDFLGDPKFKTVAHETEIETAADRDVTFDATAPLSKSDILAIANALQLCIDGEGRMVQIRKQPSFVHGYDYDDFEDGIADDLWQYLIGTGIDNHYAHNFHETDWSYRLWRLEDMYGEAVTALTRLLARSVHGQKEPGN